MKYKHERTKQGFIDKEATNWNFEGMVEIAQVLWRQPNLPNSRALE